MSKGVDVGADVSPVRVEVGRTRDRRGHTEVGVTEKCETKTNLCGTTRKK